MNEAQTRTPTVIAASVSSAYSASTKKRPKVHRPPPEAFGGDALVEATFCAAGGSMSVSWWLDKVRTGEAPQPVIRAPRFTRWKLAEVQAFWHEFVAKAASDAQAESMKDRATKASAAAKVARQARAKAVTASQAGA